MANFFVVVDPYQERRSRFVELIRQRIAPVDGLAIDDCEAEDLSALWAILPDAPLSHSADDGGMAVIWGDAIDNLTARRQNAAGLRQIWKESATPFPPYDGFYSAVVYEPKVGLCATADLLGLFPVYYYWEKEVLFISSSPELMQSHPSFKKQLSVTGLVGLLLTNGLFDGQTLWQDVHRLSAGYALVWQPGRPPVEVEQYRVPFSNRYIDLPFSRLNEVLDPALRSAVARHAPADQAHSLLLSGGLDSRVLGGYLYDNGNQVTTLTSGLPSDIETQCASRVADALEFTHRSVNVPPEAYPACSDLAAKWEHLAGGFGMINYWAMVPEMRSLAPRIVTGLLGDAIIGGSHIDWAYSVSRRTMDFGSFFRQVNNWGLECEVLKKLSPDRAFGDLVDHTLARIKDVYDGCAEYEFQRAWCFDLHHRQRFHVGGLAWKVSFGAWPVLPFVDREVLAIVAGLPTAAIAERRAEYSLVTERFPLLAQLPLDRSSYDNRPIRPRIRQQPVWYWRSKFGPWLREVQRLTGTLVERRAIYRFMDFNWAGWKTVRRYAEPYRERLFDLFIKNELERILPQPDVDVHPEEILSGSAGLKMLIGLMLFDRD